MRSKLPDRYEIDCEVGRGGMSVVYCARDSVLDRTVALKVLHEHVASKAKNRKRFRREAQAVARLDHPNIVEIFDFSEESDACSYIVMEYIEGQNLDEFLASNTLVLSELAALIGIRLCDALRHAHSKGVIHRDLKPGNVMITSKGQLKLTDFGIAHVADAETMTQTGTLLGSPAHMAPELIEASDLDRRADIYSLGTILYLLVTGSLPFSGDNPSQLLKNILQCDIQPPHLIDNRVDPAISETIVECLHRNPDKRFDSAEELRSRLQSDLDGIPTNAPADLESFFRSPESSSEKILNERIIPHLLREGKDALDNEAFSVALNKFNRILAFDPDHQEVNRQLDRLHSSRRQKKRQRWTSTAIGSVAFVGLLIWGGFWYHSLQERNEAFVQIGEQLEAARQNATEALLVEKTKRSRSEATSRAAARLAELHGNNIAGDVQKNARNLGEILRFKQQRFAGMTSSSPSRPRDDGAPEPTASDTRPTAAPKDRKQETPLEEKLTYRFNLRPPKATLYIDGNQIPRDQAISGVELTKGRHRLVAESPGCKKLERTLLVREPRRQKIPVILEWKEAKIHVIANKKSLVWVNGNERGYVGADGEDSTIDISFGDARSLQTKRLIELAVAPHSDLQDRRIQKLNLRPGSKTTVHMTF